MKKTVKVKTNFKSLVPKKDHEKDLIELEVYGLVVGPYQGRPLLLMKDKTGGDVLPVGLNELEAQILAFGSDRQDGPFGVNFSLQKTLGLKVNKTLFTEVRGQRQVINVYFGSVAGSGTDTGKNAKAETIIEGYAESSMSFCLGTKAPIYASQKFIDQCRRTPLDFHLTQSATFGRDKVPPNLVQ